MDEAADMKGQAAWTKGKRDAFLAELAATANVRASARAVGMSEGCVYRLRLRSTEFRRDWEAALREGYARLELVMLERAINGTDAEAGKAAGKMADYSDRLGLALLAAHRATVRGEETPKAEKTDKGAARRRIEAKLAEMNRRMGGET